MTLIFFIAFIIFIIGLRVQKDGLISEYASVKNTQPIKGIFILIVLLSHARQYADFPYQTDLMVIRFFNLLGQLMVAPFLFYSGYGIYESIKRKSTAYINSFPSNRIGKTFFDFSVSVLLFLLLGPFIGRSFKPMQVLLAFTGWTSVGNSNWYMFAVFCLYFIAYISFKIFDCKKNVLSLCAMSALSLVYVYILSQVQPSRFSNTALCFAAGMWYSFLKDYIDQFLRNHVFVYYVLSVIMILLFVYSYPFKDYRILMHNGVSILFCLCIVLISMKIYINSPVLDWFGKHLFWVYILQRIPMNILKAFGIPQAHPYVFIFIAVPVTMIMAHYMNILMAKAKKLIWK